MNTSDTIKKFVQDLTNAKPSAELTMRRILLQETMKLGDDVQYLKIQKDSLEA